MALGASRGRLIRQLLTESVLLATLGGAAGLLFAYWGLALLRALLPVGVGEVPRADWISIDQTVLGFSVAISVLTGIIFGLAPAIQASKPQFNEVLKDAGRSLAGGVHVRRLRDSLVVAEIALATILLLGAGLMIRSFGKLAAAEPGFDSENALTMQVWLPQSKYPDRNRIANFYEQALDKIRGIPGVKSASAINFLPFSGWGDATSLSIDGRAAAAPGQEPTAQYRVIDSDYFEAMGIPILRGRPFEEQDRDKTDRVAVINQTMARRYWANEDPIGKHIRPEFPETSTPWRPKAAREWLTIVGVVGDVKEFGAIDETPAVFYVPYLQNPSALMRLVVRSDEQVTSLLPAIRQEVRAIDKDQPVTEIKTMREFIAESAFQRRFNTALLGIFAVVALILAVVGIYGVTSYSALQRTREVGIRMALGAQSRDVLSMMVAQGMRLSLTGVGIGLAGGWVLTRVMRNLLFGVGPTDPLTYAGVALLLAGMSLAASFIPARRATKVSPIDALRYD
jgi:putative ABC transport system permease protein